MATIPTGRYTITNVRQRNLAFLEDPNDGTPVNANYGQNVDAEKVRIDLAPSLLIYLPFSGTSSS
jgi:hypothetical protein